VVRPKFRDLDGGEADPSPLPGRVTLAKSCRDRQIPGKVMLNYVICHIGLSLFGYLCVLSGDRANSLALWNRVPATIGS
jgi:hypothetical protein